MAVLHTAAIVAVGSELLTPFRSDTNSLFLTGLLNEFGVDVRQKVIVGDHVDEVAGTVTRALAGADIVLLTGGLGPTEDDVTREAVAKAVRRPLELDENVLRVIAERFQRRGLAMPPTNRRQAMVPHGGVVLPNRNGTAPGLWIEQDGKIVVLLPGPPRELQAMVEAEVRPRLAERSAGRVRRRVVRTTGRPESAVDEVAAPIYNVWRRGAVPIETSILASGGQIELHLSAVSDGSGAADAALEAAVGQLVSALGPIVISSDGRTLEQVVGGLLKARGWHLSAAESCTGGLLMGRLTEVPGSSEWFAGGVVAYDNDVKIEALGVPADLLDRYGAVSEPVAVAMADGVRARLRTDLGVAVTGIAGPTGGTPEKPVGTVVIAVSGPIASVRTVLLIGDRHMVRTFTTQIALDMVRRMLEGR